MYGTLPMRIGAHFARAFALSAVLNADALWMRLVIMFNPATRRAKEDEGWDIWSISATT